MSFINLKKIAGLLMMTCFITVAIFAEGQDMPQQDPPKNPPNIVVQPKNDRPPRDTNKGGNPPKNDNKPKKP
jgi:hypothetical protein